MLFGIQQLSNAQIYLNTIVKDSSSNEILVGVSISENGTTNNTVTNLEGKARLPFSRIGDVIFTILHQGYVSKTVSISIPQKDSIILILLSQVNNQLEEISVSSVRTNSRIENIPTRVEVLGLDDLKEENGVKPGNIMSLLGDIAGIQMQQVSASSGATYARIQGLNGRYTQLLKDGMSLFGGLSGSFGIMQIPPLDLKQIEIIKGSVSTLYGGDAIGGIINLVSKEPTKKRELTATVNQTTLLESNLNIYYAKRYRKIGFTLFGGYTLQTQKDIDKDGLSDVPNINSTVIHPKLIFYINPKSTLTLNYTGTFDHRKGGDMQYFSAKLNDSLFHIQNKIRRNNSDVKWVHQFSKKNNLTVKFSNSYLT